MLEGQWVWGWVSRKWDFCWEGCVSMKQSCQSSCISSIEMQSTPAQSHTEAPLACHTAICSAKSTSSHLTPLFYHPTTVFFFFLYLPFFAFLVYSYDIKNKFIKKSSIFILAAHGCCPLVGRWFRRAASGMGGMFLRTELLPPLALFQGNNIWCASL